MTEPWKDPIVEEIRKIRDEHAANFNYDLDLIFADILERQRQSGRTYVSYPPVRPKEVRPTQAKEADKAEEPVGTAP